MEWGFKVNQDGAAPDGVLLRVKVDGWGQVHTLARLVSIVANTPEPVLGYKPPQMTADVLDPDGNEVLSLGGRNSWDVPDEAPVPQNRPRMRM